MQRRSFMKLMATSAVGVGAAGAVTGCKVKGGGNSSIRPSTRFISVATGQKFTVNVYNGSSSGSVLNNNVTLDTTATGTPNGAFSEFQQIDWEGTYTIGLLPPGSTNFNAAYGSYAFSPAQGAHYTGYVFPASSTTTSTASLGITVLNDDPQTVGSGQYVIRILNTMASPASFSLYLTQAGTTSSIPLGSGSDLTSAQLIMSSTAGPGISPSSGYSTAATSGTFRLRLTTVVAGANNTSNEIVLFDTDNVTLAGGAAYTLVTYTLGSSTLPTVMLVTPSGDPVILTNNLTRIRAIQGSSDVTGTSTSNMLINGNKRASLTFGDASDYFIVQAGKALVQFQTSDSPNAPYLSISNQTFVGGQDYTVYSTTPSTVANPGSLVLVDNNLPLSNGSQAGVTFVNATAAGDPQASTVHITMNSTYLNVAGSSANLPVTSGSATSTLQFQVKDYKVSFLNANSNDAPIVNGFDIGATTGATGGLVAAGAIYTVALVGTGNSNGSQAGNFKVVVKQSNTFGN